mmetsp:Transcript_28933/g.35796  ORF Transcript_28933/g.35796 Transcript_28933/m.35796 type:complete len:81 (+) Transcript_28933:17-259(+)
MLDGSCRLDDSLEASTAQCRISSDASRIRLEESKGDITIGDSIDMKLLKSSNDMLARSNDSQQPMPVSALRKIKSSMVGV